MFHVKHFFHKSVEAYLYLGEFLKKLDAEVPFYTPILWKYAKIKVKEVITMSKRYENILVAVDGSHNSEKAFSEAVEIAKEQKAHLFIVCIINEVEIAYSAYAYSKLLAEERENVEKELLKRVYDAKEAGIQEVTPIVEIGNVKEILTKALPEAYNLDLLIVGATGKGVIQRATMGSTASYVVNHASCNVMVVK